jgi:recombination protein RecT
MANIEKKKDEVSIRGLLSGDKFKAEIQRALPAHLKPDRFIRVALTAMTKTPKLAQCDKASFFNCLLSLSQLGIEPDGRRAHLIPFENRKRGVTECQLIIDYKGIVELVMRSGNVSNIHADVLCMNDVFEYDRGEIKTHRIDFKQPRGEVYGAYAICRFKDGTEKTEVMTKGEIESIRKRSRAGQDGPWVTDWNEMAKKTVFRRLSKWLTLSPEQRDVLEKDDDQLEPIAHSVKFVDIEPEKGIKALENKLSEEPQEPEEQEAPEALDTEANTEEKPSEPIEEPDARIVGKVKAVAGKPTKKKGVTRYGILIIEQDGEVETWVNTFDSKLFDAAIDYKANEITVEALARTTEYGLDLESISELVEDAN